MSRIIHITNLPLYYDDYGLQDIFSEIGEITATTVSKNGIISKATGFVEFASSKHARLAASKKDQIVIANSAVRVYLVWTPEEDLSTVKVCNIESDATETELAQYFDPYGGIVDVRITHCCSTTAGGADDDEKTSIAFVSFCRVDYALQAVQEMNGTIVGSSGALKVALMNPDARNLKWKRNSFEYTRMTVPQLNSATQTAANHYQNKHAQRRPHRQHRSRYYHRQSEAMVHEQQHQHQQQQNQQTASNSNPNIIIVNNIGSIHNNTNTKEGDNQYTHTQNSNELLHPLYGNNHHRHYRRAQNFNNHHDSSSHSSPQRYSHSLSPNGPGSRSHPQARREHKQRQHRVHGYDESYHHHHHPHAADNSHDDEHHQAHRGQQHRTRKFRSQRSTQSTLFGPLHNFSNGQYRTYSVTPSPTRSADDVDSVTEQQQQHQQHVQQQQQSRRRALDHYGGGNQQLHSPQPYQLQTPTTIFLPAPAHTMSTPISPATTVSTPSTTHSMPTPTGYLTGGNTVTFMSQTPSALSIPALVTRTPTGLSPSATTPVSTPPSTTNLQHAAMHPVFAPQTQANLNYLHAMNLLNANALQGIDSGMSALHMQSALMQQQQQQQQQAHTLPTSPPNASPIVLPPQTNLLLQTHIGQVTTTQNPAVVISPSNLQQPFVFYSPHSPSQQFMFSTSEDENRNTNNGNSNDNVGKKSKKSGSHSWTKEQEALGNKLYKLVAQTYPDHATKVVGMLLMGHSVEDLKFMMERPAILTPLIQNYNEKQLARKKRKSMVHQLQAPTVFISASV